MKKGTQDENSILPRFILSAFVVACALISIVNVAHAEFSISRVSSWNNLGFVTSLDISPDGQNILVALGIAGDSQVWVLDATDGRKVRRIGAGHRLETAEYSEDGTRILATTIYGVEFYSSDTGKQLQSFPLLGGRLLDRDKSIASGEVTGKVLPFVNMIDSKSGVAKGAVPGSIFDASPDGTTLYTGYAITEDIVGGFTSAMSSRLCAYSMGELRPLAKRNLGGLITRSLDCSHTDPLLAIGGYIYDTRGTNISNGWVVIVDTKTLAVTDRVDSLQTYSLAFNPLHSLLLAAGYEYYATGGPFQRRTRAKMVLRDLKTKQSAVLLREGASNFLFAAWLPNAEEFFIVEDTGDQGRVISKFKITH